MNNRRGTIGNAVSVIPLEVLGAFVYRVVAGYSFSGFDLGICCSATVDP